jgi:hypothetical protein
MTPSDAEPLTIDRAELVHRLERTGPPIEGIRNRLVDWAETRATYFYIFSDVGTPLNQIPGAWAPSSERWLDDFDEAIAWHLQLKDEDIDELLARENNLTIEELDRRLEPVEPQALKIMRGIRVEVID